jgi:hypothetical protein
MSPVPAERKNLARPDEMIRLPEVVEEVVDLGELTVGRTISQPGWRWSTHVKPLVGGDWCQARHIGVVLSGCMGVVFRTLGQAAGLEFEDRGTYELKGLEGEWPLSALVA